MNQKSFVQMLGKPVNNKSTAGAAVAWSLIALANNVQKELFHGRGRIVHLNQLTTMFLDHVRDFVLCRVG